MLTALLLCLMGPAGIVIILLGNRELVVCFTLFIFVSVVVCLLFRLMSLVSFVLSFPGQLHHFVTTWPTKTYNHEIGDVE